MTENYEVSILYLSLTIILFPLVIFKNIPKGLNKVNHFIDKYLPEFKQSYIIVITIWVKNYIEKIKLEKKAKYLSSHWIYE